MENQEIIQELLRGNDKELRDTFFGFIRLLEQQSNTGHIAWSELVEHIQKHIKVGNELVELYWLE